MPALRQQELDIGTHIKLTIFTHQWCYQLVNDCHGCLIKRDIQTY